MSINKQEGDDKLETRKGYLFEVDLSYPLELHDKFKNYPPAPIHMAISNDMLSPYQIRLKQKMENMKTKIENKKENEPKLRESKVEKLMCTLYNKKKYVIHYKLLQHYIELGMKLDKVHRVIKFKESKFLEPFIMQNTRYRTEAKTEFEKDLYKLMNNAIYGKSNENVRKRIDFKLVTTKDKHKKLATKAQYKDSIEFSEDLVGVLSSKTKVTIDKPIYMGQAILDLSKYLMYDFYYNTLQKEFPQVELLMTDTDSLFINVRCKPEEYDSFMTRNLDKFDTSAYPKDHQHYSEKNKKVVGKFKSETNEKEITEFVGLRSKLYSYTVEDDSKIHSKAKGTKKCLAEKINIEKYLQTLQEEKSLLVDQQTFRSYKHTIHTINQRKVALSPFDDKNYLYDSINSVPYGYKGKEIDLS